MGIKPEEPSDVQWFFSYEPEFWYELARAKELTTGKERGSLHQMGKKAQFGTREQANLLFQLISIRYERGSTILTSNYAFHEWGRIFDDHVVASAIIDRLVHHAHIFPISGSSWRIRDKLKRGVE